MTCAVSLEPKAVAERRERVAALTRDGWSAQQIAALEGISDRSVVRYRSVTGVSRQCRNRPLSETELATAARLLDEGCSYAEVGRTLRRSPSAIRRHLPGRGWPVGESAKFALQIRWTNCRAARIGVLL